MTEKRNVVEQLLPPRVVQFVVDNRFRLVVEPDGIWAQDPQGRPHAEVVAEFERSPTRAAPDVEDSPRASDRYVGER